MTIVVFSLLRVPHASAFAAEDTTLRIVLHYIWIGPFVFGVRLPAVMKANCSDKNIQHDNFFPIAW